jgi:hypothetical protein
MGTVKIGDRDVTLEEPCIAKVEEIGKRLSNVGKGAPDLQRRLAQFVRDYERDNAVQMDRHTALVRAPKRVKHLSESDWKQMGQKVTLPVSPTGTEQLLAMAPYVFDEAREQALEVVALLMVPDEVMERPDEIERQIEANKQVLRYKAKPSQLVRLLSECTDIVHEVMEHEKDAVGKLRRFWESLVRRQDPRSEREREHEAALAEVEETLGESGASESSTDSATATAGDTERSSTGSPLATVSPS